MRLLVLGLVALTALSVASSAQASRPPTRAERAAIIKVTRDYVDTSDCCAVITRIRVHGIRVSTVDRRWAVVVLNGYDQHGQDIGYAAAVLHRGYLTGKWSVRDFGSDFLGCDMPSKVRRDLRQDC